LLTLFAALDSVRDLRFSLLAASSQQVNASCQGLNQRAAITASLNSLDKEIFIAMDLANAKAMAPVLSLLLRSALLVMIATLHISAMMLTTFCVAYASLAMSALIMVTRLTSTWAAGSMGVPIGGDAFCALFRERFLRILDPILTLLMKDVGAPSLVRSLAALRGLHWL
jgi:hypothetical protein